MKEPASTRRSRSASPVVRGSALKRPLRLWMTGSLAVVMAAFVPARSMAAGPGEAQRLLRHSRYGVEETAARIEAAARSSGLSVLARTSGQQPVIVLASSVGGTLVIMDEASARIEIPLSVRLAESPDGGVDVSIGAARGGLPAELGDLPSAVADDLAALPALLDRALG